MSVYTLVVTGGIATGKSSLTQHLCRLAGDTLIHFDCDAVVHTLLDSPALAPALLAAFGPRVLRDDGHADRDYLRGLVFSDSDARARLESVIYPALLQECLAQRAQAVQNARVRGFLIDMPLFYEHNLGSQYPHDGVCLVATSPATQLRRLALRNGHPDHLNKAILDAQLPIMSKIAAADFLIWNEGPPEQLHNQAYMLYRHLFV